MPDRCEQLRSAIANLAASADQQAAYLDRLHGPLKASGSSADHSNDELALEFDDVFHAAAHLIDASELIASQRDAALPLNDLLEQLSGKENAAFWKRDALWSDARWGQVRALAKRALAAFDH